MRYSVLLKTIVNVRFGFITAKSQVDAIDRIQQFVDGKVMHDLFRAGRMLGTPQGCPNIEYVEWAEDHAMALVDEEGDEHYEKSLFYDQFHGRWVLYDFGPEAVEMLKAVLRMTIFDPKLEDPYMLSDKDREVLDRAVKFLREVGEVEDVEEEEEPAGGPGVREDGEGPG